MKKLLLFTLFGFIIINTYAYNKKIITSYYPLYFIAKNIAPDWEITNLSEQDPHKFSPSPQDILRTQKADLFIYFSKELEFWAPELIAKNKNGFSIKQKLPLLFFHLSEGKEESKDDKDHKDHKDHHEHEDHKGHKDHHEHEDHKGHKDHHENEDHKDHEDHKGHKDHHENEDHKGHKDHHENEDHKDHEDHEEHNHSSGVDPHVWLSPLAMEKITLLLGEEFAKIDSENSNNLLNNSKILAKKFSLLHDTYQDSLKNCKRNEVILSHNFLGYLSRLYGFQTYNIAGLSTLDEPSGKTILKIKKLGKEKNLYFLKENFSSNQIAEILQKEANIKSLYIDNLTTNRGDFLERMQKNASSLKIALVCK